MTIYGIFMQSIHFMIHFKPFCIQSVFWTALERGLCVSCFDYFTLPIYWSVTLVIKSGYLLGEKDRDKFELRSAIAKLSVFVTRT